MHCHMCQADAVGRCYECGRLYCPAHDVNGNCTVCATGIKVSTADKVSTRALPTRAGRAWWRPQIDEDDPGPPSCYHCGGLANRVCRNCANLFCPEHGKGFDLCSACARSSIQSLWIIFAVFACMAVALLVATLKG